MEPANFLLTKFCEDGQRTICKKIYEGGQSLPFANDQIFLRTCDNGPISPEDMVRSLDTAKTPRPKNPNSLKIAIKVFWCQLLCVGSIWHETLLKPDCWQNSHTVIVTRQSEMWRDYDEQNCSAIATIKIVIDQNCNNKNAIIRLPLNNNNNNHHQRPSETPSYQTSFPILRTIPPCFGEPDNWHYSIIWMVSVVL